MNFNNLHAIAKRQNDFLREEYAMDSMESRARKEMADATADGSLDDPKIQRKIGDARMKLDLCSSRRGHVEAGLRAAFAELRAEYSALKKEYNNLVATRREGIRQQIETSLRPWFEGESRRLEQVLNATEWPVMYELGRAGWDGFTPQAKTASDLADEVKHFMRHTRRFAKLCKFELGDPAQGEE